MDYNFNLIETKWQKYWDENKIYKTNILSDKPKFYVLDMFPYPSGAGLHVGHPEGYTATDIIARMKRMQGFEVMHPIGWDAFGLPAEQYALKTGNNPKEFTKHNIDTFRRQIKNLGFSYDWDREINTTDPKYYKWTQWIFKKLFENGLAEIKEVPVNFCPGCKTVLANEEVINGRCERKGHLVIKKPMKQWVLKITKYADRLLEDLDLLNWPKSLKEQQINWIGKSSGTVVKFKIQDNKGTLEAFTTRPDTIYGVSYLVVAAEHPCIQTITAEEKKEEVDKFVQSTINKSDLERTELNNNKKGIFTGTCAINPITQEEIEIWVGDYVLNSYGSGAVMAVPAHDTRDYQFAIKYNLKIKKVIESNIEKEAFIGDGKHINSKELDGLNNQKAIIKINDILEKKKLGYKTINYKLKDWLFSRQRYWGEPFPIYFDNENNPQVVNDADLPIKLPSLEKIEPAADGGSPLEDAPNWKYENYNLDTNTMPQWAGSCWYYLRYLDPDNDEELIDKEIAKKWLPVDFYIGGAEHAVLHLLYARFWHKFLYDIGIVPTKEPFQTVVNQGMILGENHEKMSKSRGNVVNPDDIVEKYGADALRVYEMFMGPLEASVVWNTNGLDGVKKFLDKVWKLYQNKEFVLENKKMEKLYQQTIKKVEEDYIKLSFNTAISQMMIFINSALKEEGITREQGLGFIKILYPIAPHITSEIWSIIKDNIDDDLEKQSWPKYDERKIVDDEVEIIIQINGKIKKKIIIENGTSTEELEKIATKNILEFLDDKKIIKIIAVRNKLVNFVVK